MKYKFLEHTADIKFQAFGKTLNEVFENSASAMFNSIHDGKIKSKIKKEILVKGKNLESLMYNFLEELIFLFDTEGFCVSKIKVQISKDKQHLKAQIFGDSAEKYEMHVHVKAITYNEMFIKLKEGKWVAQIVLDV